MMRHPRSAVVAQARNEIGSAIAGIALRHNLTYAEMFAVLGGEVTSYARYAVRDERHPGNPDQPGDEACDETCTHPREREI